MKDNIGIIIGIIFFIAIIVGCLWLSRVWFDAIINSDISSFWKYILLK